ncbi:hypothetical protein A6R70_21345 [Agrobacterium rubi]|nr:hypothetical protein [Agrobacterium rubi]
MTFSNAGIRHRTILYLCGYGKCHFFNQNSYLAIRTIITYFQRVNSFHCMVVGSHPFIWTVTIPEVRLREHEDEYPRHFMTIDVMDRTASLELVQRIYFTAMLGFYGELKEFTDIAFRSAVVRRPRKKS